MINIPIFHWSGVLGDPQNYEYIVPHRAVEKWCRERNIAYLDLLPAIASEDISKIRVSDTDNHFNDVGHQLVGAKLNEFVVDLVERLE